MIDDMRELRLALGETTNMLEAAHADLIAAGAKCIGRPRCSFMQIIERNRALLASSPAPDAGESP